MIYIWTDESDTTGKYYANFYGGILIRSKHLEEVLARLSAVVKEQGLENEEIKVAESKRSKIKMPIFATKI